MDRQPVAPEKRRVLEALIRVIDLGEPIGNPWVFTLLAIVIVAASYSLITKGLGARQFEVAVSKPDRVNGAPNLN